jgi:deoxyribonuclease-4
MPKFRIGRHINASYDFVSAPAYAHRIGCNMMQIFLGNPQKNSNRVRSNKELNGFAEQLTSNKMKLVIHGSYAINLCHPPSSSKYKASVRALIKELDMATIIGKRCIGVIIHMGKNIPENEISDATAIQNYVFGLQEALKGSPQKAIIILETGAGQGNEVGTDIGTLSAIYRELTKYEQSRVKFCIDTCHIWASGNDISTSDKVKLFFKNFDKLIGIDRIACFHFNDSKTPLDSHLDRHADLGHGYIPIDGLRAIARFARDHHIPIILETPLDSINPKTNKDVTFSDEHKKIMSFLK